MFPVLLISVTPMGRRNPLFLAPVVPQQQPATTFIFGNVRGNPGPSFWTSRARSRREHQRSDLAMMSIVLGLIQMLIIRGAPEPQWGLTPRLNSLTHEPWLMATILNCRCLEQNLQPNQTAW